VHTASGQLDAASEVYQSLTQTPSQDAVVLHVTALECRRHQRQIHGFRHTVLKISQYDTNDLALQR
jgi:hypothetical protein